MKETEFVEHFRYLADTPGWERVLEAIAKHVKSSRTDGDDLVVELDRKDTCFVATPPAKESYAKWPAAFRALMTHHELISFPNTGWGLTLGDCESVDFEVDELSEIREVMADYSDWWVVADGGISRLSHESCELDEVTELGPGALFLKRVAEVLELEVTWPEPAHAPSRALRVGRTGKLTIDKGATFYADIEGAPEWFAVATPTELAFFDGTPRELGRCATTAFVGTSFGHVKLQRIGDDVYIGHGRGFACVSMSDPARPRIVRSLFTDAMRTTHAFAKDDVVFHYYLNDEDAIEQRESNGASPEEARAYPLGGGIFRQPLAGGPSSIVRAGDYARYGHDSVTVGDAVLFVSQKGIDVYDWKKSAVIAGPRLGTFWPRIVSCAPHPLAAVIETDDRSNYAVRMIDLSKKKPSAGKKLFKKSDVKLSCIDGDRLWLLLRTDTKKGERVSLGAVQLPQCDEVTPVDLPPELAWNDAAWMRASADGLTVVFEDGTTAVLS